MSLDDLVVLNSITMNSARRLCRPTPIRLRWQDGASRSRPLA